MNRDRKERDRKPDTGASEDTNRQATTELLSSSEGRKSAPPEGGRRDFIRDIIDADLESGRHTKVVTRFPPEPNGYLHIGHAKSLCLNFGLAQEYAGQCNLRFDDTNPMAEEASFEASIAHDIAWLGFSWGEHLFHASDYFAQLHDYAVQLIEKDLAYVCSLSLEEMRRLRGSVTEAGLPSPDRERPLFENLELFSRMRAGEFPDGALTLRAKIDMANPNMKMRDPPLYRIRHQAHHRAGDAWCIYPMYDFAHGLSDSIEGITHSICTLEFENNRELYDWFLEKLEVPTPRPRQYEFARLNLSHTVMSKRKLRQLVEQGLVEGWDDPRMPTLAGLRRRGVTPESIRAFTDMIGVAKANSLVDLGKLEYCIRNDLNAKAPRRMAVLRPLRLVLDNYPEGQVEHFSAPDFPPDVAPPEKLPPVRELPFSRTLYIEQDDFQEQPEKGFRRLSPGQEVRLKYAYFVTCTQVVRDEAGELLELHGRYDPESRGGESPDGRKVKGTLHWVSAEHSVPLEVRLYDRLFSVERPDAFEGDYRECLNPDSLITLSARCEPSLSQLAPGEAVQLERQGYFVADSKGNSEAEANGPLVLGRTVTLKDGWSKTRAKPALPTKPGQDKPGTKAARSKKSAASATPTAPRRLTPEAAALVASDGLGEEVAEALCSSADRLAFYKETVAAGAAPPLAGKWIANVLVGMAAGRKLDALYLSPAQFASLLRSLSEQTITGAGAREVLGVLLGGNSTQRSVDKIIEARGLASRNDTDLDTLALKLIADHPDEVTRYREGKTTLLGFFVGQAMRATKGGADPVALKQALQNALS